MSNISSTRSASQKTFELKVGRLGEGGDGIAEVGDARWLVPETLPGERVLARDRGHRGPYRLVEVERRLGDSPDRTVPPCRHFPFCGGCQVQHLNDAAYRAWKQELLSVSLHRAGLQPEALDPLHVVPPKSRRRVVLHAERGRRRIKLGFMAQASRQLIDLEMCEVMAPELFSSLVDVRQLLEIAIEPGSKADVELLLTESGPDVLLHLRRAPGRAQEAQLGAATAGTGLARLSIATARGGVETLLQTAQPVLRFAGVPVAFPPGAFAQPTVDGEQALTAFVAEALKPASRVLEFFAGCGTFTVPLLTAGHQVRAMEGGAGAVAALKAATDRHQLSRLKAEARDLVRRPPQPGEFEGQEAVLLDPPRAGASTVIGPIAASDVQRVVYVSCNPVTFARDARELGQAGFRLARIRPIDQFRWSRHLELAALLVRE